MKVKIIFLLVLLVSLAGTLFAQIPQAIPYQAMARDNSNTSLINTPITVEFKIREGSPTGTLSFHESHAVTTNSLGMFSISIGGGALQAGSFGTINWGTAGGTFLEVIVDGQSIGNNPFQAVPYALYAPSSGSTLPSAADKQTLYYDGNLNQWRPTSALQTDGANNMISVNSGFVPNTVFTLGTRAGFSELTLASLSATDTANIFSNTDLLVNSSKRMLYGAANGHLFLSGTPSQPRLFINSTGEVGIGTVTPAYNLDVVGSFRAIASVSTDHVYTNQLDMATYSLPTVAGSPGEILTANGPGNQLTWAPAIGTPVWSVNGSTLYPTNTAMNVGIGTTSAAHPLTIASNSFPQIGFNATSRTGIASLTNFQLSTSGDSLELISSKFFNVRRGGTSVLFIQNTGAVGISTLVPKSTIDVNGSVGFSGILSIPQGNNATTISLADPYMVYIFNTSGTNTFTLPDASFCKGRTIVMKQGPSITGGSLSIAPCCGQTVDGLTSGATGLSFALPGSGIKLCITIISDGFNWFIINKI